MQPRQKFVFRTLFNPIPALFPVIFADYVVDEVERREKLGIPVKPEDIANIIGVTAKKKWKPLLVFLVVALGLSLIINNLSKIIKK